MEFNFNLMYSRGYNCSVRTEIKVTRQILVRTHNIVFRLYPSIWNKRTDRHVIPIMFSPT